MLSWAQNKAFLRLDRLSEEDANNTLPHNLATIVNSDREQPTRELIENARYYSRLQYDDCSKLNEFIETELANLVKPTEWYKFLNNQNIENTLINACRNDNIDDNCITLVTSMVDRLQTAAPLLGYPRSDFCEGHEFN